MAATTAGARDKPRDGTLVDSERIAHLPPLELRRAAWPRSRRDKGQPQLTPRDLTTLMWIGEQYAVRVDYLQRLLARQSGRPTRVAGLLSATTTADIIARWQRVGLVEVRKVLAGELAWVWLTRAGLHELGLDYAPYRPTAFHLPHLHAVNTVRLLVESQHDGHGGQSQHAPMWQSERTLRAAEALMRSPALRTKGKPRPHLPDAVVQLEAERPTGHSPDAEHPGPRVAVEVELSVKTHERLATILDALVNRYAAVWYFVAPEVAGSVPRAFGELEPRAQRLVRVYTLAGEELRLPKQPTGR